MRQFLNKIENEHPYITSLFVSIAIIMWFRGIIGIIDIVFMKKDSIKNYLLLMGLSLIILYITNVGINVIFDIQQRRKINKLLKTDDILLEEDQELLLHQVHNHHKHISSTLYPTLHAY